MNGLFCTANGLIVKERKITTEGRIRGSNIITAAGLLLSVAAGEQYVPTIKEVDHMDTIRDTCRYLEEEKRLRRVMARLSREFLVLLDERGVTVGEYLAVPREEQIALEKEGGVYVEGAEE